MTREEILKKLEEEWGWRLGSSEKLDICIKEYVHHVYRFIPVSSEVHEGRTLYCSITADKLIEKNFDVQFSIHYDVILYDEYDYDESHFINFEIVKLLVALIEFDKEMIMNE